MVTTAPTGIVPWVDSMTLEEVRVKVPSIWIKPLIATKAALMLEGTGVPVNVTVVVATPVIVLLALLVELSFKE